MSHGNEFGFSFFTPSQSHCTPKNDLYFRRSAEHVPISQAGIGTSIANTYGFKYPRTTGVIPNYGGHVPGERFMIGMTYDQATRDARNYLNTHKELNERS